MRFALSLVALLTLCTFADADGGIGRGRGLLRGRSVGGCASAQFAAPAYAPVFQVQVQAAPVYAPVCAPAVFSAPVYQAPVRQQSFFSERSVIRQRSFSSGY